MRKEDTMNGRITSDRNKSWLATYVWLLAVFWTAVIGASVTWNLLNQNRGMREIVLSEARAYFNKDQAFRLWVASHGGVYVASDERTPPNPYLAHVPERDIETPSGNQLTLMNPAHVVRQMNEEFADLYGVAGQITSLKPLRPQNAPDDWERKVLTAFSHGEKEVTEFTEVNGERHLRLMRPLITTEKCLQCHAHQGYQVGDVRGGVGVSVPMTRLRAVERQQAAVVVLGHGGLWLLGLLGIGLGTRQVSQRINAEKAREAAEAIAERQRAEITLRETQRINAEKAREAAEAIAERQRAEIALRETEAAYSLLVETILRQIGNYELEEKLGQGGMGVVFKARQVKLNRLVAIKVLPDSRLQDKAAIGRFEREKAAIGKLGHSNIIQAYDAGEFNGIHFLVMEYVDGIALSEVVRRVGPVSVPDACEIACQAARGLQHAHERGIVHRDVKPSNLMVTRSGVVKVLDLGLALLRHDRTELTMSGQIMGTLDYMAPEQLRDSHNIDHRADIYALGALLYTLLAGATPYGATAYRSPIDKIDSIIRDSVHPITDLRTDIPERLQAVTEQMLAKDPANRFNKAQDVAGELAQYASGADLELLVTRTSSHSSDTDTGAQSTETFAE